MAPLALALLLALFQTPAPVPQDTTEAPQTETEEAAADVAEVTDVLDDDSAYDRDEEDGPGLQFRPRVAPSALYSSNRGFGIGGGVGIRNVFYPGTDLVLDLRLQQRYQGADVTFYSDDPYETERHLLVSAGASTTERRRYFGLGPNTVPDSEINLYHDAAQAEVRFGYYPFGTTVLYLQPGVRALYDYSGGVNLGASEDGLALLDERSREAVQIAEDESRYGLSPGLEIATDLRDWPAYPRSGGFATLEARRFFALDGSDLRIDRLAGSYIGYIPIRGRTTIIVRGVGIVTRSADSDDDGERDPIPFYYLPTLDDRVATAFKQDRLTGRDIVAFGTGIRAPLYDFLGAYGIDGLVMGYVGNAYDNVFEQFRPTVSFEEGSTVTDGRTALRPAIGVGLGLVNLDKERVVLGGLLGIGPGGVTVATLRIAYDLRDARPLFR